MGGCCEDKCGALAALREKQSRVLKTVLVINAIMFVVELSAGLFYRSSSVLADSLDMFGDAVVYASSLYVLGRGPLWNARIAILKGGIMMAFGLGVLADGVAKVLASSPPDAQGMGIIGMSALAANLYCLHLLARHRTDDINMRSVWICSRNDIAANLGVLVASAAVAASRTRWPDLIVGALIAALFARSAISILRAALTQRRELASAAARPA
ncbi:MAG: cation transporter [Deltaproteobacteria bacterium]|nr:cation transporter [Deltaproteobacteria bacterium]